RRCPPRRPSAATRPRQPAVRRAAPAGAPRAPVGLALREARTTPGRPVAATTAGRCPATAPPRRCPPPRPCVATPPRRPAVPRAAPAGTTPPLEVLPLPVTPGRAP